MSLSQALTKIENNAIDFVRFELSDIHGIARSKLITVPNFKKKATDGINYNIGFMAYEPRGPCVPEVTEYRDDTGFPDCVCYPDFDTFTVLPWCDSTARILIEPTFRGNPVRAYPRFIARQQLDRLKDLGYSLLSAHEYEFYLVDRDTKKPTNMDQNTRATLRNCQAITLTNKIARQLPKVGVHVECVETEHGTGQMEISYAPAFGIRAADNAHTYKIGIKELADQENLIASFMTKPFLDQDCSGCHLCHSLWDIDGKTPLLYDPDSPINLSATAQHWMAGILAHAPAITILMASTVNCFSRFTSCEMGPGHGTWGEDNRTCFLRVKINGRKGTYIENRAGSSASNPYLLLAATVAAGIDGIQRKLPLPPGITKSAYDKENVPSECSSIPTNMPDALTAFLEDKVITEAFGDEFVKVFTAVKKHEMKVVEEAKAKGDDMFMNKLYFDYI